MKQNTHLLAHVAISAGVGADSSRPRSRPRRSRPSVCSTPSRATVSSRCSSPAWNWKSIASRSGAPLTARMRSPTASPAVAAAVRRRIAATTTPPSAGGATSPRGSAPERGFIRFLAPRGGGGLPQGAPRQALVTREPSVEEVGQRRHREDEERDPELAIDEQRHEDGNQNDAENGQPVREAHTTLAVYHRIRESAGDKPPPYEVAT